MKNKHWIILILVLASLIRFYGLSRGDTVNDEVFYGFRAIGMMDFDEADDQTTPWEWTDPNIPKWARLSFHDHPPLVFIVQNISISVFGENNFAMRLPSAILGIISVYLLYLLVIRLYSESVGLIAASLMAVTLNSVYISRVGMQEAFVIFFILLASYFFIKALEKDNYLIWTGVALGLGFLAKYNVFILLMIFCTYLLFFRRDYFRNKKLWFGALAAFAIFSPVVIYNFMLRKNFGHFDFQFSYIFGQNPDVWKTAPGKEIGTIYERLKSFPSRLIATNSWLFLAVFGTSMLAGLAGIFKKRLAFLKEHSFLVIAFVYILLLITVIGPSYRFLTMLTPFTAIFAALLAVHIYKTFLKKRRGTAVLIFGAFIFFEIFYSINNQIAYYPTGSHTWFSSKVRYENYNWGYNELGEFFEKELAGKIPAIRFNARYQFIEEEQNKYIAKGKKRGFELHPAMIVIYGDFDRIAKLWVLDRLHIYHGWPVINLETYLGYLAENGPDYYNRVGFRYRYVVWKTGIAQSPELRLLVGNTVPEVITNQRGDEVFKIYKIPF